MQQFDLTQDGRRIAFVTDEEGVSVLHVMDTAAEKEVPLPKLPVGRDRRPEMAQKRPRIGIFVKQRT